MANEIAIQQKEAMKRLESALDQRQAKIAERIRSSGTSYDVFRDQVLMAVTANKDILRCTYESLYRAIMESVISRLPLGTTIQPLAYIVPFHNKKTGEWIATLIPSYLGRLDLVARTGEYAGYHADVVHEGDHFRIHAGTNYSIEHSPAMDAERDSRPITHVYVVVKMKDGRTVCNVWSAARVQAHKERYSQGWRKAESNGKKDSPWHTSWLQMAWKTLIIDLVKRGRLPLHNRYQELIARDEEQLTQGGGAIVDGSTMPALEADGPEEQELLEAPAVEDAARTVDGVPADDSVQIVMSPDESNWWEAHLEALSRCKNLGQVTAVRESWMAAIESHTNADELEAAQCDAAKLCHDREVAIREGRATAAASA